MAALKHYDRSKVIKCKNALSEGRTFLMEEFPSSIIAEHINEFTVEHTEHIAALNKKHHSTSRLTLNITALKEFEKVFPVYREDLFN